MKRLLAILSLSLTAGLGLAACDSASKPPPESDATGQTEVYSDSSDYSDEEIEEMIVEAYGEPQGSYTDMFLGDYDVSVVNETAGTLSGVFRFTLDEEQDRVLMTAADPGSNDKVYVCEYDLNSLGKNSFMQILLCTPMDTELVPDGVNAFVELAFEAEGGQVTLEGEGYLANDTERVTLATYSGTKVK